MGCHVNYYQKLPKITYRKICDAAYDNMRTSPELYEDSEYTPHQYLLAARDARIAFSEVLDRAGYKIVDGHICRQLEKPVFIFRTFDYDDKPLHSLEETLAHIDRYCRWPQNAIMKLKRVAWVIGLFFAKIFHPNTAYTHTHKMQYSIELIHDYTDTVRRLRIFWEKYPDAIIAFE